MFEKNKKIIAFSFFNSLLSSFLDNRDISFLRCDLREVANLLNKKKISSLKEEDIKTLKSYYNGKIPLSVDVPLFSLLSKNEKSIKKMLGKFSVKINLARLVI